MEEWNERRKRRIGWRGGYKATESFEEGRKKVGKRKNDERGDGIQKKKGRLVQVGTLN